MGSPRRARSIVAVLVAAVMGLAGCTPASPLGLRHQEGQLVVVLGSQCKPSRYLTKLEVRNIDEKTNDWASPSLWVIEAQEPQNVTEVELGSVPAGFKEVENNLGRTPLAERLSIGATFGDDREAATLRPSEIKGGQVIAANGDLMTPEKFREEYGCN